MLKDILDAERTARQTLANERAAIDAEHKAIVGAIHAEFDKHREELSKLMLLGDYGRPAPIKLDRSAQSDGIAIGLASQYKPGKVVLSVSRRTDERPPMATLQQCYGYPYKDLPPQTLPGHAPADQLVLGLLKLLAPHIHMEIGK